jgi:hypothetical protein
MPRLASRRSLVALAAFTLSSLGHASDHLDTPTVIGDPAADIGDLYAWTSSDGARLNLVMTLVGGKFSDRLRYAFNVDSGTVLGATAASTAIVCDFDVANAVDCRVERDRAHGDASDAVGLESTRHGFRVFAGLRDDPFFNNVRGTRAALNVAAAALVSGASRNAGGCPAFVAPTVSKIREEWRHTEGHAATNLLAGWKTAALVIAVDLDLVDRGGPLLGVWATTALRDGRILDRMGRALTGNALLGTFEPEDAGNRRKEDYNRAERQDWPGFAADLAVNLAVYDGFDGVCGNQWLAVGNANPATRYSDLARLLADDRLWVNSAARSCTQYLAAEFNYVGATNDDCGGRTPNYDAVDVFRSLLAGGQTRGIDDGIEHDEQAHSLTIFPFLAPP